MRHKDSAGCVPLSTSPAQIVRLRLPATIVISDQVWSFTIVNVCPTFLLVSTMIVELQGLAILTVLAALVPPTALLARF